MRRNTRCFSLGEVNIGSDHPISVQSMTKTDTRDIEKTVEQINELEMAGCDIATASAAKPKLLNFTKAAKYFNCFNEIFFISFSYNKYKKM